MDPIRSEDDPHAEGLAVGDAVLGLDNVRLDLPLAGLGSRGLAVALDMVMLFVLTLLWGLLMMTLASFSSQTAAWFYAVFAIGSFLIQWGYFSICEILMDGQTPGKTITGLRTVSRLGGRPSVAAVLVRNLLRSLDYLVGAPVMALDRRRRRLGDMAAGTLVLHYREARLGEERRLARVPESWGGKEIGVVESFLRRADRMEPDVADELAARLLAWTESAEPDFVASGEPELGGSSLERLRHIFDWSAVPISEALLAEGTATGSLS
ncbi:MAG: RDD family protein [Holophagales bacterium]|nr:RDD family protein [Holophagales bacterium]